MMSQNKLISTNEAAKILGVSASRIRQLIIDGRLEATKIGRDQLLDEEKVVNFSSKPRKRTGRPKHSIS